MFKRWGGMPSLGRSGVHNERFKRQKSDKRTFRGERGGDRSNVIGSGAKKKSSLLQLTDAGQNRQGGNGALPRGGEEKHPFEETCQILLPDEANKGVRAEIKAQLNRNLKGLLGFRLHPEYGVIIKKISSIGKGAHF